MIPLSLPFIEVIQAFRRREFGWYSFITKYSILINDGEEQSNAKQKDTKIDYVILTFQPESLIVKYLYPTVSWEFKNYFEDAGNETSSNDELVIETWNNSIQ